MTLNCCYFCGFSDETALSEHHVIPKRIDGPEAHDGQTVTVCRNCHKKVHDLVDPVIKRLSDDADEHSNTRNVPHRVKCLKKFIDNRKADAVSRTSIEYFLDIHDLPHETVKHARQLGEIYELEDDTFRTV